jgi:hypothetical protein
MENNLLTDKHVFDQPCKHGCRCGDIIILCNSADINSPIKCRHTWYTNGAIKDEECPFYSPNPLYDYVGIKSINVKL